MLQIFILYCIALSNDIRDIIIYYYLWLPTLRSVFRLVYCIYYVQAITSLNFSLFQFLDMSLDLNISGRVCLMPDE